MTEQSVHWLQWRCGFEHGVSNWGFVADLLASMVTDWSRCLVWLIGGIKSEGATLRDWNSQSRMALCCGPEWEWWLETLRDEWRSRVEPDRITMLLHGCFVACRMADAREVAGLDFMDNGPFWELDDRVAIHLQVADEGLFLVRSRNAEVIQSVQHFVESRDVDRLIKILSSGHSELP